MKLKAIFAAALLGFLGADAANPYLPLWEHIPDGEPHVFDDPDVPGKQRIYIYGSHDVSRDMYCGRDLVLWSASVDSLDNWRYDGVIFEVTANGAGNPLNDEGLGDVLFAPDVAEVRLPDGSKEYYLYPNNQGGGRNGMVAKASRPDGPFEVINWDPENPWATVGVLRFDPAVLVDDDGRVYAFWGFGESFAGELDPATMATLKEGTEPVRDIVSRIDDDNNIGHFFEASSIRKVGDKYVFIYSRRAPEGQWGLPMSNYTLAYAYSQWPLGPYTYGGTIIDARGRDTDASGRTFATATPNGNTHGSIAEINGRWYVFFHRQTGLDEYSRQAMVAPVEVSYEPGPGGRVFISEAEYTSEGFETSGLDPLRRYPAAIASHFTGPTTAYQTYPTMNYSGPYFEPFYLPEPAMADPYSDEINVNRVVNNTDGSILGYKYFNFDGLKGAKKVRLALDLVPEGVDGRIDVYVAAPWKGDPAPVGSCTIKAADAGRAATVEIPLEGIGRLSGKHPLYLTFSSDTKGRSICTITHLQFRK